MRMKENEMNNGQTKPGYNLQIGIENLFILDFGLFQSPGDTFTMVPFFKSFFERYRKLPGIGVADSSYGSEENYRFMEEAGIAAYVKYNWFLVNSACTMNPTCSVRNLYIIMPKGTIMSARWDSTWNALAQHDRRREADMLPKAHATRPDAVRDPASGKLLQS